MATLTKEENIHSLKGSPQSFRDNAQEMANEMKQDLRMAANQAGRKVRGFFNSASDEISHATEAVTTQIRNKPVQSSLIALGVGVLAGLLLRR